MCLKVYGSGLLSTSTGELCSLHYLVNWINSWLPRVHCQEKLGTLVIIVNNEDGHGLVLEGFLSQWSGVFLEVNISKTKVNCIFIFFFFCHVVFLPDRKLAAVHSADALGRFTRSIFFLLKSLNLHSLSLVSDLSTFLTIGNNQHCQLVQHQSLTTLWRQQDQIFCQKWRENDSPRSRTWIVLPQWINTVCLFVGNCCRLQ